MGQVLSRRANSLASQVQLADLNLIEAQRSRAIIDVEIVGAKQTYQSVILRVDIASGSMLIDELFPAGFIGVTGQPLTITVRRMDGSRVGFATQIIDRSHSDGVDNYRVKLPATIDYRQRREAFRLSMPRDSKVFSEFCTADNQFCAALVQDVSVAGIRLALQNSIEVGAGDVLTGLDFEFAGHSFSCRADVRHIHRDRFGGIAIGAEFRDFPRVQQRVLERLIMQYQRRSVRLAREAAEPSAVPA